MSRTRNAVGTLATGTIVPLMLILLGLSSCAGVVTGSFSNVPVGTGNNPEPGTSGQAKELLVGHNESIIAGNGVVYVGSDNGRLYAFNAATGRVEWQQGLGGPVDVQTVTGGVVYASSAASGPGQSTGDLAAVYALAAASGQVLWQFHQASAGGYSVLVSGGMVVASASAPGNHFTLSGLQAGTGRLVWQRTTASFFTSLLGASTGVVYTSEMSNPDPAVGTSTLIALDSASGEVRWRLAIAPDEGMAAGPPVESRGILYVKTTTGAVYALHPNDGTVLWQVSASRASEPPAPGGPNYLSPIVADGLVYAGSESGVSAYRASDGVPIWHYQQVVASGSLVPQPMLISDVLYVSISGLAVALSPSTGTVLWQRPSNGRSSLLLAGDGVVITGTSALDALKASDGSQLWQLSLPEGPQEGGVVGGPEALGGNASGGAVYVGTYGGVVQALGASTGKQLWQFTIPELPAPTDLAYNVVVTFKPGTTFIKALLDVTSLGLKTATACASGWTNLDSLQATFPSNHTLLVGATVASAPQWYDRLKALPEMSSLQANLITLCPQELAHPTGPDFLPVQQMGTYVLATFSSATTYDAALEGIDGLGFRLAAPCYELARAHGDKPTWQPLSQAGGFTTSHSLILATTTENATIWLQQLQALPGVQSMESSYACRG